MRKWRRNERAKKTSKSIVMNNKIVKKLFEYRACMISIPRVSILIIAMMTRMMYVRIAMPRPRLKSILFCGSFMFINLSYFL